MTELNTNPSDLAQAQSTLQPGLADVYMRELQSDLFASGSQLRPANIASIATTESEAVWESLARSNPEHGGARGAQLVRLGLGEETFFRLLDQTRSYVREHLPPQLRGSAMTTLEAYQRGALQGYSTTRRLMMLEEQERMRAAYERTVRRYARELELAAEVARAATSILDLNELMRTVAEQVRQSFNHYFVGIFLLDEFGRYAILRGGTGVSGQELMRRDFKIERGDESLVGWCAEHGSVRVGHDLGADPVHFNTPFLENTHSELVLPLSAHGTLIGVLSVQSHQSDAFNEHDVSALRVVADQLANAIENARLFAQARDSLEAMRTAQRALVSEAWSSGQSNAVLYEQSTDSFRQAPDLWYPEMRQVMEQKQPVVLQPDGANVDRSVLALPLTLRGEVIGAIDLYDVAASKQWTDEDIVLAQAVTSQAALALENARLVSELEERVRQRTAELSRANVQLQDQNAFMEALHETTLGLMNRLELGDVLQSIVARAAALAGTQHGYLFLLEQSEREMVMQVGTGFFAQRVGDRIQPGQTVAGAVWRKGEPQAVNDYSNWPGRAPDPVFDQVKALVAVPLKSGTKIVGVLGLGHVETDADQRFDDTSLEHVVQFAQLASVAVDNARLYSAVQDELTQRRQIEVQLAQARDEALAAAKLKSEFLANMSHEIRTPMNAVIGMTGLLTNTRLDTRQRYFVETIHSSGDTLLAIIDDILDLSKMEAGKLQLDSTDFEPLAAVEEAAELLAARAREKNLSLMTFVSPDIPAVIKGDPVRLRQVLLNLMGNAIKFTEHGEVVVSADLAEETETHVTLRFSVSDTGVGLSSAARDRLFQPFTQADGSTTRKYGGTGLGLSISKHLVELMQGQIDVESEEGKGSRFWFDARFEKSSGAPAARPFSAAALHGLRVLIVDDGQASRELLSRYVDSWGMRSQAAASADEALDILHAAAAEGDAYLVVLVDLVIAGMDVFSFAHRVRSQPDTSHTKLILLTALEEEGLDQRALEVGFTACLTKPVRQSSLFDTLANAFYSDANSRTGSFIQKPRSVFDGGARIPPPMPSAENLILIAEDHPVNREVAILQLQQLGLAAHAVENGTAAIEAIQRVPYALVLMDCQMPELDGYEATRLIRRSEAQSGRHVPIIAMTAHAMQGDREACLSAGMDDYISKPVTLERLEAVVRHWMPRVRVQGQSPEPAGSTVLQSDPSPANGAANGATVDFKVIEDLRSMQGSDLTFLRQLVTTFFSQSGLLLENMRSAVSRSDAEALRQSAHKLKGGCGVLGVKNLANICYDAEMQARTGRLEGALEKVERAEAEYERVKAALEPVVQGGMQ